jgi:hypothetical protein
VRDREIEKQRVVEKQRDKETERQRDRETERQRNKETERQRAVLNCLDGGLRKWLWRGEEIKHRRCTKGGPGSGGERVSSKKMQ